MRILVTGGAGFIGSHVVDAYVEAGHEVAVVDDLSSGARQNVNPAAAFHQLSILDPCLEEVFAAHQPQVVNHHAAQIDVRRSVADPAHDIEVNVVGTVRVLERCAAHGVERVIFSSTGGAIYGEPEYLPADESHPVKPLAPYGLDKFAAEQFLRIFQQQGGPKCSILRYANVYGPRQDPHGEAGVIAIFANAMLRGDAPTIFGNGEQTRDFVYVGDVVRANILATEADPPGPVNIGTGRPTSVNDLYALMAALTGFQHAARHAPERPGEVREIYLDCRLAERCLGWSAQVPMDDGLTRVVEHFRGAA
ncbi:MAG: NAD-dependent epimerase/dehydratase family protein [Armatimonadota bacterium]|nr:MAG: NAD-dependent epimerase/dehydratase family protein [Armatimonadota bacterium]